MERKAAKNMMETWEKATSRPLTYETISKWSHKHENGFSLTHYKRYAN